MRLRCLLVISVAACSSSMVPGEEREPSISVCAKGATVMGVDVSAEVVDWQAFSAGGWDFAIAKASEGVTFVESQFATNWKEMKAAGVVRGAYCFFHPRPDDPIVEADFFVDTVDQAGGFEPGDIPALDLEVLDGDSADAVAADALAWLARVKRDTGITPIVYTSPRVFDTLLNSPAGFADYPLWDVTWNGGPPKCPNIPASWPGWAFWQYAGDSIGGPGLPGSMNDGDVFNGTRDDLIAFAKSLGAGPGPADAGTGLADAGPGPADAGSADAGTAARPDAALADAPPGSADPPWLDVTLTGGCSVAGGPGRETPVGLVALYLVVVALRCRPRRLGG